MTAAAYLAFAAAGFQRYATYRQAMVAAMFTNSVFGFLRCAVLLAVASGGARAVAGYDEPRLAPGGARSGRGIVQADGRRITYALDGGAPTAGELVRRLAEVAALRDISVLEPDIEDVVARLYTGLIGGPSPPRTPFVVNEGLADRRRGEV